MIITTFPTGSRSSIGVELVSAVVFEASSLVIVEPDFWEVVPDFWEVIPLPLDADAVSVADVVPLDCDPVSETVADLSVCVFVG